MSTSSFWDSPIGSVVAPYRPSLHQETVHTWANHHQDQATQLTENANASELSYGPLFQELLQGRTGDALQASLGQNNNLWHSDAMEHQDAATALNSAADYLHGLCTDLEGIVNHYQPLYETANNNYNNAYNTLTQLGLNNPEGQFLAWEMQNYASEAQGYVDNAQSEAETATEHAAVNISTALNGKFGNAPAGSNQQTPSVGTQPPPMLPPMGPLPPMNQAPTQPSTNQPSTSQQNPNAGTQPASWVGTGIGGASPVAALADLPSHDIVA